MKRISSRIITGLLIIVVGAALLLSNLNVLSFGDLVKDWWPMAIIVAGLIIFINDRRSYLWSLIVVAFGVLLQVRELGVVDVNPWQLIWPVIIIAVGVSIIVNRSANANRISKDDRQDVTAILSGSEQKNHSQDFKGSKITAIMGGVVVDLRKAVIKKEATIEIFGLWGGVELFVPEDVVVKNQLSHILGGSENKTTPSTKADAPVLNIIGDVIMAGVEIKN